jgi:hypothetical protein
MKALILITSIFLFTACGGEKKSEEQQEKANTNSEKKEASTVSESAFPLEDIRWLEGYWVEIDETTGKIKDRTEKWFFDEGQLVSIRTDKDVNGVQQKLVSTSIDYLNNKITYFTPNGFQKEGNILRLAQAKENPNNLIFVNPESGYPKEICYRKLGGDKLEIITAGLLKSENGGPPAHVSSAYIFQKQITIEDIHWLEGHWAEDSKDSEGEATMLFHEEWKAEKDRLFGSGSLENVKDGTTKALEQIAIEWRDGTLHYAATVGNQNDGNTIYFRLLSTTADSLHFKNPEHDFPRQIIYVKKDEGKRLEVTLTGINDKGEEIEQTFNLYQQ